MITRVEQLSSQHLDSRAMQAERIVHTVHPTGIFTKIEPHEINQSVPTRFEEMVRRFPNRIALKSKYHQLTYTELNQAANRIAHTLLNSLGDASEPIALLFEHDIHIVAAMLGVLKAGKFFVVLDTSLPNARLDFILGDTETRLILSDTQHQHQATKLAGGKRAVKEFSQLQSDNTLSPENPNLLIPPEAYAYLVYTSGTSGEPKGVIENHVDILHFVRARANVIYYTPEDRFTQPSPFSFSGVMSTLLGAILMGAAFYPFDTSREGIHNLSKWLIQEQVTIAVMVPAVYRQMVAYLQGDERFRALRHLGLGGDPTFEADVASFRKIFEPGTALRIGYGTSEVKIISDYFIDHHTQIPQGTIPVGYSVVETEILLVDNDDNEVAPGEVGEVIVRSPYVCPGYWRRPEITAAKFAVDPTDKRQRLYRTGDLGRMDEDGCLYHLGRKDFQVKVRGQRVEVEEIENTLLKIDGVKEAAVVLRKVGAGDERLVAFIATGTNGPSISAIRARLATTLPSYMIPGHFMRLDQLPHNVNGKIDKLALPALDEERPERENEYIKPAPGIEATIAKIWAQFLGVAQVGAHDDFFDLGGHSMLAVQMMTALEKALYRKIPVAALIQGQTVRGMAEWLDGQTPTLAPRMVVPIQEGGNQLPIYLVPPVEASALSFVEFARELGDDQPVYAIDDASLQPGHWRVEDQAAYYLSELQGVQPTGPYIIGGRCFGAVVALEMTRQLEAKGEEVALLIILEGTSPKVEKPQGLRGRARHYAKMIYKYVRHGAVGDFIMGYLQWHWTLFQNRELRRHSKRSYAPYKAEAVAAPIVVYESHQYYQLLYHERWQQWTQGGVNYQRLPGTTHDSIWHTEVAVRQIAQDLAKRLTS